jgi:hypothetical protein
VSVIPCEVPLIILDPFAFVLYGNGYNMVVLLLKIVLDEQVTHLLCICKVQNLRLLIVASCWAMTGSLYMLYNLLFPNLHII